MLLDASTLPALARGCAILGAGGGGDTQVGLLAGLQADPPGGDGDRRDLAEPAVMTDERGNVIVFRATDGD